MKVSQRQLYADRIERVVRHLEARAPEEGVPSVAELAAVAAMSEFHFHRVFRLMTGETVGETVRRLRLARTLPELESEATVARAAGASGYATSQAYARALKAQAGTSARTARADPANLDSLAAALRTPQRTSAEAAPAIAVEVVSVEPFRLLAMRNVGDYAELNAAYGRLFDLVLAQVAPERLDGIYGVPHDDPRFTPAAQCRFECALAVDEGTAEGELAELSLGGGDHVRLRHLGDYDRLPETIDRAYAAAITLFDRELGDAAPYVHYLDDPDEVPEPLLRADVYVPLR